MSLTEDNILEQKSLIRGGTPSIELVRPADDGDGIVPLEKEAALRAYRKHIEGKELVNFIPASGKATRMFGFLLKEGDADGSKQKFLKSIADFPFSDEVKSLSEEEIPQFILEKLGYADLPKALIPFHRYGLKNRTAFEEHIESFQNFFKHRGVCHFSMDKQHVPLFKKLLKSIDPKVPVHFSCQNQARKTITLDENDRLVYDKEGNLVLNPGGHGVLIENLNQIDTDVILIQNVDGIPREEYHQQIMEVKKSLLGMLFLLQDKVFDSLKILDQPIDEKSLEDIKKMAESELNIFIEEYDKKNHEQKVQELKRLLNRPLRVCGVVSNDGQPGGAPFWVTDGEGKVSLQLVEQAQVNAEEKQQLNLFEQSKYFNPVNIVCGVRDYKGNKFNLDQYTNEFRYFISKKYHEGKCIRILERMGLWNGAMEYWNTIFVALPKWTFTPVKTVNNLLDPMHQPQ